MKIKLTECTLNQQLELLKKFMVSKNALKRRSKALRLVTANTHIQRIRQILGWMHHQQQVPLKDLYLHSIIPCSGFEDGKPNRDLVMEALEPFLLFLEWLEVERNCCVRYQVTFISAMVVLVKFLYGNESKIPVYFEDNSLRSVTFRDIPVLQALRQLQASKHREARRAPLVADDSKKWVEWPHFLKVTKAMQQECLPFDENGKRRSDRDIAAGFQKYIMCGIFTGLPERQRTLRELALGRTLFKRGTTWTIEQRAEDIKVEKYAEGGTRILPLPESIYPALEAWLHGYEDENGNWQGWIDENGERKGWRSVFRPDHNFVFTRPNGTPFDTTTFCVFFKQIMHYYTGQACNPHLLRDIVVTHAMKRGEPEYKLRAIATLMGHEFETQQRNYDRRTPQEKIKPGMDVLDSFRNQEDQDS